MGVILPSSDMLSKSQYSPEKKNGRCRNAGTVGNIACQYHFINAASIAQEENGFHSGLHFNIDMGGLAEMLNSVMDKHRRCTMY